jgi:hypothetical protein
MARFFPADPLNNYASELAVRAALAHLDDNWRVFHSVVWQSKRYGRQGDGEADFVLLHPSHGLVVLEVKGGSLVEVENGQWYSVNSRTRRRVPIKNPFEQAKVSKYALLNYLRSVAPRLADVPIAHAVAFPGASHSASVGPYGPRALVLDAVDLLDPEKAVNRLVAHWGYEARLSHGDIDEITRRLAPTTTIRRRLGSVVGAANAELLQLTKAQQLAFHITRTRRRAAVQGGPGTGKTVLALERARYLADDGFNVLLTCFNRPLANQLAKAVSDSSVTVATFHSLCLSQARQAGLMTATSDVDDWHDTAADLLVDAASSTGLQFDAVIIDEGQDFAADWFDALQMLLAGAETGVLYVFYDPRQALMQPSWELPDGLESFPLDWNCRNTLAIARKVCNVYGDELLALGTQGEPPQWIKSESIDGALRIIQDLVDNLLTAEDLTPQQIVVLSDSRPIIERLRRMVVTDVGFVDLEGVGVVAETVHRFKGLEADVLILLISSATGSHDELRSLAYVGMSRARTMLIVVGPKSARKVISWEGAPSSNPSSVAGR